MAKKKPSATSLYSVHPSIAYVGAVLENVPDKTGRSVAEWVKLIHAAGLADEKEMRDWLKRVHKIGGTTASILAHQAAGKGDEDINPDAYLRRAPQYVEAMYAGAKAQLRPIHDALIDLGRALGPDVKICPCQTIVPIYRNHVIAEIKPATQKRIDFGLALKGAAKKAPARLKDTGGLTKGDRITHRIPIATLEEIDDEVNRWLRVAYDLDGASAK